MAAEVKKWVKETNENFDFDGLKLLKNSKKLICYAHCWVVYLIGYTFVIQKIAVKCKPDSSRFFL